MNWIFWAPLAAVVIHVIEEFIYPGHFAEWYHQYKPEFRKSATWRLFAVINGLLLILCYDIVALGPGRISVATWLFVMAILSANSVWHIRGTVRTRRYSPGLITGLVVYLPLAVYGYVLFLKSKQVSITTALIVFAVGASYQFWGNMLHRIRSREKKS